MCAGKHAPEGYELDEPKLHFSEVKKLGTKEPAGKIARILLNSKRILALTSIGNVSSSCSEL